MFRSLESIKGLKIDTKDGQIGHVDDLYFDDEEWKVRYFIVETGNWLVEKKVLLSQTSIKNVDWVSQTVSVNLTKEQIEKSPDVEQDKPVSRQKEYELAQHYAWPVYWPVADGVPLNEAVALQARQAQGEALADGNNHLRSVNEVQKYSIQSTDNPMGVVEDLIVDDESWIIRYLVVNTRRILPGKKVLLSPTWAEEIDWSTQTVHVNLTAETIKNSPTFDPYDPVNKKYEEHLYDYYGRPKYWI